MLKCTFSKLELYPRYIVLAKKKKKKVFSNIHKHYWLFLATMTIDIIWPWQCAMHPGRELRHFRRVKMTYQQTNFHEAFGNCVSILRTYFWRWTTKLVFLVCNVDWLSLFQILFFLIIILRLKIMLLSLQRF